MMPSMLGSLIDAEAAGYRALKCAHCGGWTWWPPEHELSDGTRKAGRVFCSTKHCETAEGAAREAATAQPVKVCGCGISYDAKTFAALALVGRQAFDPGDGEPGWDHEYRNCPCGSTLVVDMAQ